ncbi:hypothetical protein M378DRAFT_109298 [Amanita muscaria Koide BX008]|uniref:Transketolase-like pyrimidine-binding domain-containing protein n=1 Tax=Amanita muscaria (strain Koide BX008) TaxID=946122 RepID=A0A0C2WYQ7_AMAMK|nr:hypothetical protein M378DRAFT_109298 [Amanita muscaria Koide BX008]
MSYLLTTPFPIDLSKFKKLSLDPSKPQLTAEQKQDLSDNIQLVRDAIVVFTATGAARGVSGHTGGAYDTVPEVCILLALFNFSEKFYPVVFDEAGHRVATQYILAALEGSLPAEQLLHYRAAHSKLPGHPELGLTPGVKFSSGRLGHMWPMVNGVALANREKTVFCLGSDGSQQEGDDAEAARLAAAQNLNVKLLIDDNDVTIAGHPSQYLKGYDVAKTLEGHGIKVVKVQGEDIDALWGAISSVITYNGPAAVISKRVMAPGVPDIEGTPHGHDVIPIKSAIKYLKASGYDKLNDVTVEDFYARIKPRPSPFLYQGSSKEYGANRVVFGEAVNLVLDKLSKEEAAKKVLVIDSDLEGSTGLKVIHQKHPEVFIPSGIMERGNFSAAAGFGFDPEKFGVFSTFSAFLEMVISEATMARLNHCNVLCHFSHAGSEADNTCHLGINNFFADNGLEDAPSWLYFPADPAQMIAVIERVFFEKGLRFVFSTRSKVPYILKEDGSRYFDEKYKFVPGKDEIIAEGTDGYVVTFGEMLYRSWDAVIRCRAQGIKVGLINKPTLNHVDEQVIKKIGQTSFVLVVESQNQKTGLGSKFGTWLLERGLTPKYAYIGAKKEGSGGLWEQIPYQGLDPQAIIRGIKELAGLI